MPDEIQIKPAGKDTSIFAAASQLPEGAKPADANENGDGGGESKNAANVATDKLAARREIRAAGKPGRHKADCACEKCAAGLTNRFKTDKPRLADGKQNSAGSAIAKIPEKVNPPITPEERAMGKAAIVAATNLMDSFSLVLLTMVAKKKGADKTTLDEVSKKAIMPEATRKGISDSGAVVLEKYNALKFAPEVSLGLFFAAWLSSQMMMIVALVKIPEKEESAD